MIHLLLADDHQIILDGMVNLLENQEDIRIIATCKNGKEVLQQLHHEKVDVLLLDLDMPVMNGFECAKEVQKSFPFVKIVILTMHEEKALIQEFTHMKMMYFTIFTFQLITKKDLDFILQPDINTVRNLIFGFGTEFGIIGMKKPC